MIPTCVFLFRHGPAFLLVEVHETFRRFGTAAALELGELTHRLASALADTAASRAAKLGGGKTITWELVIRCQIHGAISCVEFTFVTVHYAERKCQFH